MLKPEYLRIQSLNEPILFWTSKISRHYCIEKLFSFVCIRSLTKIEKHQPKPVFFSFKSFQYREKHDINLHCASSKYMQLCLTVWRVNQCCSYGRNSDKKKFRWILPLTYASVVSSSASIAKQFEYSIVLHFYVCNFAPLILSGVYNERRL